MTRQQAIEKLKAIQEWSKADKEGAHVDADEVLILLLDELGYGDVTAEFNKIEKWYA